ncbi:hypothetical protein FA09DRAFT_113704 [Tilletiopsis washingtonensis]|uniref:Uncharacterized protein n=1 Tax=Tilletiopsis washingtonensis TaxID=58919 RepID=A0A316ZKE1_9BASI|nr:hypothetical protein FA09DRAFT_113704 [Tilletiopsis washingtonensis]PWO00774.1 hypothetical protein FA09DRAFT_113704 [Tilletiopsis washingtonensis]
MLGDARLPRCSALAGRLPCAREFAATALSPPAQGRCGRLPISRVQRRARGAHTRATPHLTVARCTRGREMRRRRSVMAEGRSQAQAGQGKPREGPAAAALPRRAREQASAPLGRPRPAVLKEAELPSGADRPRRALVVAAGTSAGLLCGL